MYKKRGLLLFFVSIYLISTISGLSFVTTNFFHNDTNATYDGSFFHLSVLDNGLKLYMPFDVQHGATNITYDYTSNNNDGTVINGTVFNSSGGVAGGAYNFDGINDHINLTSSSTLQTLSMYNNHTVSIWFKANNSSNSYLFSSYSPSNYLVLVVYGSTGLRLAYYNGTFYAKSTTTAFNDNRWHNVIAMRENNVTRLFVDKVEMNGSSVASVSNTQGVYLGVVHNSGFFNGSVDDIMIFNRSLNATEIAQIYNYTFPRFYPSGEVIVKNLNLSNLENISLDSCLTLNGTYLNGKVLNNPLQNFSSCNLESYDFTGLSNINRTNLTINLFSDQNSSFTPIAGINFVSKIGTPIVSGNLNFSNTTLLSWPPVNYTDGCYGAECNPTGNPIGGFVNYSRIIHPSDANYYVNTVEEFIYILENELVSGEIIYINDSVILDFTDYDMILIPDNITIASGRGNGYSKGAIIRKNIKNYSGSDTTVILFKVHGENVLFTGLRFDGGDIDCNYEYHSAINSEGRSDLSEGFYSIYKVSEAITVNASKLEVDNCEFYGWRQAGIAVLAGSSNDYIHHNYMHNNCHYGVGYGSYLGTGINSALFEANLFNNNRHSIAGASSSSPYYEARYNLNLEKKSGHSFDRHSNANQTIVHHNTFFSNPYWDLEGVEFTGPANVINGAQIYNNWFKYLSLSSSISTKYSNGSYSSVPGALGTNVTIWNNFINSTEAPTGTYLPILIISTSTSNVSVNKNVLFESSLTNLGNNSIRYIEWDFGDNSSLEYGNSVNHIFTQHGRYLVKATFSDNVGFVNSSYISINVLPLDQQKHYLDFWIFENSYVDSQEYVEKQAIIDGEILWRQNFSDNVTQWQHISIEIPSRLIEDDIVNLTLGVSTVKNYTDPLYPNTHDVEFFEVAFDDIAVFEPGCYSGGLGFESGETWVGLDNSTTDWTNLSWYDRSIEREFSYEVSPHFRDNFTSGEYVGFSKLIRLTNCAPILEVSSVDEVGNPVLYSIFRPSENNLRKGYSIKIRETQKVEIPIRDKKEVVVESVNEEKIVVSVDGKNYNLNGNENAKIDLDSDGYYDVEISVNGDTVNGYANLKFVLINEEVPSEVEEEKNENILDEIPDVIKKIDWKVYALIGVVAVLVVIVFLLNRKKTFLNKNSLFRIVKR